MLKDVASAGRDRAPWGTLSREQVVEAAERVVARGEFEHMTIRSLAADLGVSPMSLYRHVRDKDDLLDEVVDHLMARRWRPRSSREQWREWITEAAERFRHFLVSQPAALHVYLGHPVVSPTSVRRMTAMIEVLVSSGLDASEARRAYAAIHTYTIGFAALESSRARSSSEEDNLDELGRELASFTTARQFGDGLAYLLNGIANGLG